MEIIPRSTSVVAKRLPPARNNRGTAEKYVSGKMNTYALNQGRTEKSNVSKPSAPSAKTNEVSKITGDTEEERIKAMFQASTANWDSAQKEMEG